MCGCGFRGRPREEDRVAAHRWAEGCARMHSGGGARSSVVRAAAHCVLAATATGACGCLPSQRSRSHTCDRSRAGRGRRSTCLALGASLTHPTPRGYPVATPWLHFGHPTWLLRRARASCDCAHAARHRCYVRPIIRGRGRGRSRPRLPVRLDSVWQANVNRCCVAGTSRPGRPHTSSRCARAYSDSARAPYLKARMPSMLKCEKNSRMRREPPGPEQGQGQAQGKGQGNGNGGRTG
jgi:hypothetical protein